MNTKLNFRFFYYGTTAEERFDQLATKGFNSKSENLVRGLFPLIPGKLSHKEGYDMGPMEYENETLDEKAERNQNPFIADTPKLYFPNDRQRKVDKLYSVSVFKNIFGNSGTSLIISILGCKQVH